MKNSNYRGEWAGSSHLTERVEELRKAHEEFLKVKDMLDAGWTIKSARVKRPRIPKAPKEVIVSLFGGKVRMTFAEYQQHGDGLKVLMEIF